MYKGVQRNETGRRVSTLRLQRQSTTDQLAGKIGICSLAAPEAHVQNQDRWDQSEKAAGPRSVRSCEGRNRALPSFGGRWRRAPVSASAPRGLRSVRRPLSASPVMACRARQPHPPTEPGSSSAPGAPGAQQGRVPPGLPLGPPSNARDAGIGVPCRTSARPLLCSETGSTPGEHGWGGVSVLKALLAQQGVDVQVQSRAVQEGGPPGGCRQTSLAEMGPVPAPVRSAQWPGGACPRLGQG